MIYLFDRMETIDPSLADRMFRILPQWRRQQADKFRFPIDRNLSVISYLLLASGLRQQYHIRELPRFSYLDCGKPFLPDYPRIHFSITHCCMGAACAIAEHPVGLDMQNIEPHSPELAEYIFSPKEQAMIQQANNPDAEFVRLWCRRESYAKLTGRGVYRDLHSFNDDKISRLCCFSTMQTTRYCLTLAEYRKHAKPL